MLNLCGQIDTNTGTIDCDVSREILLKPFFGGKQFDKTDYATPATFKAAFIAACKLERGNGNKIFPFPELQGVTNNSESNKEGTLPFGFKKVLIEGKPAYTCTAIVGQSTFTKLRKFNNKTVRFFGHDNGGNLWGMLTSDGKFAGYEATMFVSGNGFGNDSDIVTATIQISILSSIDFNESAKYVQWPGSINDARGLIDVNLEYVSNTSSAYKIGVHAPTSEFSKTINLHSTYATQLASVSLWKATNVATGASIGVSTVQKDDALKCWTVTLDATAWGALAPGAQVLIELATPPVLDAADVVGIEGVGVVVTK